MRPRLPSCGVLRACPNATPGPSRLPAGAVKIYRHSLPVTQIRNESTIPTRRTRQASTSASSTSTSTPSLTTSTSPSAYPHPAFDQLSTSLSSWLPCFGARGDEVKLLTSPGGFYGDVIEMMKRAKRRILISTLYIGVDTIRSALKANPHLRTTFILDYHRSTRLSKPTPSSSVPTPAPAPTQAGAQGQDGGGNSKTETQSQTPTQPLPLSTAHLLLPLIEEFGDRVEVWFFRSPNLKGLLEKVVPERYDEGWGTWHGKWYAVDDEVVLSGANLANSYFTNRQDRYIHFRSHPSLLSYLSSLTRLYSTYSYLLSPSPPPSAPPQYIVPLRQPPSTSPQAGLYWHHPSIHPRHFAPHALATLTAFQNSWKGSNAGRMRRVDVDTFFWPVIQAGVLGIQEEEKGLGRVWEAVAQSYQHQKQSVPAPAPPSAPASTITEASGKGPGVKEGNDKDKSSVDEKEVTAKREEKPRGVQVDLTSGYFGLYDAYKRMVIESPAPVRVIAASPKSNGFYGSKGLSRLIPEGYTYLESRFHRDASKAGRLWDEQKSSGVRLREWERDGWTYHSKGIWLSPQGPSSSPFFTFVGSSNLSNRSLKYDTELSLLLMTSSPSLRKALAQEVQNLNLNARDVGEETWKLEERKVSWLAWLLIKIGVEGYL